MFLRCDSMFNDCHVMAVKSSYFIDVFVVVFDLSDSFTWLLLLLARYIPKSELFLFCYKLLQGIFRFFIIFCWCMQRTDGGLHHNHLVIYTIFSFFFLHIYSILFGSPTQFSYAGSWFFVPEISFKSISLWCFYKPLS